MDNEQLLMQLGKFDFLARTPGLGARVPVERDDLRRLLADSDELARLRAEIAAKAAGWRAEPDGSYDYDQGHAHGCRDCADDLVALLRLPAGEG